MPDFSSDEVMNIPTRHNPQHPEMVRMLLKDRGVWFSDMPDMLGVRDG